MLRALLTTRVGARTLAAAAALAVVVVAVLAVVVPRVA